MAKRKINDEQEINREDAANFASDPTKFRINRSKKLQELYADDASLKRRYEQTNTYRATTYANAKAVRTALDQAISNRDSIVEASKKLYATNPIYASIIDYISNMYM